MFPALRAVLALVLLTAVSWGQSVCLPAPRLLNTTPMGGQIGTTVEVTISGQHIEDVEALFFSHPGLSAVFKTTPEGLPVANTFLVTIAPDCPIGVHEARVVTRLGVSSSRVFNVGTLPEVTRSAANTTLETAMVLPLDTVCNAFLTRQAVDFYRFQATSGQRIVVDCASRTIDSKAKPVVIVADAQGNDLQVERRGGVVDFQVPATGDYVVKVHDLTFNGGNECFYRLVLRTAEPGALVARFPGTRTVNSFSWPPTGLPVDAALAEAEPNPPAQAQPLTLPCDVAGAFFPAADVDTFEFSAKKGEIWWVEVASERFGLPTDPALVVQRVQPAGTEPALVDVVELSDIPSPVKVSSNGYAYDGPPYHAGSADILGKVEIPEDGTYRLQLTDLFGGTRSDPNNRYRMVIRQAQPDFAVVAWPLHMELRNGDRNALSKPIAMRGGSTIAYEVVVIRRDGFDGAIDLELQNLPDGITATGLRIGANKTRGILLITAAEGAPRGHSMANFVGSATINGEQVTRTGHMATVAWPIPDSWGEIPAPRLMADIPVSVSDSEQAPITLSAVEEKVFEAQVGETVKIPLKHSVRSEFSGPKMSLRAFGEGFEGVPGFEVPLDPSGSEATLDLKALNVQPGDYTLAFYGTAVARYRYNPNAVAVAEVALKQAQELVAARTAEAKIALEATQAAEADKQADLQRVAEEAARQQKGAEEALAAADKQLKDVTAQAAPKDIAEIVISSPIRIRVSPEKAANP